VKRHLPLIKVLFNLIIFILAISFEGASPERMVILVLLFAGFLTWGFIRPYIREEQPWLYCLDIVLIYLLEYQSKYPVNYFFHIMYISIILEAGITMDRRQGNFIAVAASVTALSKFVMVMKFGINAAAISQLLFNLFALAFLITLLNYGKLQYEEKQRSQMLYRELVEAYQKLKELSRQKEKAVILEERNRIARDIHDMLGHRLTSVIMQLEMIKQYLNTRPDRVEEMLDRCSQGAREALADARGAVKALKGKETFGLEGIKQMIEEFRRDTGIEIEESLPHLDLRLDESRVLFRVIQESITNAVKHGKATRISVNIKAEKRMLKFIIEDNGIGAEYTEGFGITSMRERLGKLGGTLKIDASSGFKVMGEFPLGGIGND